MALKTTIFFLLLTMFAEATKAKKSINSQSNIQLFRQRLSKKA